jgi:hypothetical protein
VSEDVRAVLVRLRRRVNKDRRFFERIMDQRIGIERERPLGESKVCIAIAAYIDKELRKLPKPPPIKVNP